MSSLFFGLMVYSKSVSFLWLIFSLVLTGLVTLIVIWLTYLIYGDILKYEGECCNSESGIKQGKKLIKKSKKLLKSVVIVFIIFMVITSFLVIKPTQKEILTYYILKQVDSYNDSNETSNFNPENVMKGVDETITKITDLADKFLGKLATKEKVTELKDEVKDGLGL